MTEFDDKPLLEIIRLAARTEAAEHELAELKSRLLMFNNEESFSLAQMARVGPTLEEAAARHSFNAIGRLIGETSRAFTVLDRERKSEGLLTRRWTVTVLLRAVE